MKHLERMRYFCYLATRLLLEEECSRIQAYAGTTEGDQSNIISILKVKPGENSGEEKGNLYYMYSKENKRYEQKTSAQMMETLTGLDKKLFRIIGLFDKYAPQNRDALKL